MLGASLMTVSYATDIVSNMGKKYKYTAKLHNQS